MHGNGRRLWLRISILCLPAKSLFLSIGKNSKISLDFVNLKLCNGLLLVTGDETCILTVG